MRTADPEMASRLLLRGECDLGACPAGRGTAACWPYYVNDSVNYSRSWDGCNGPSSLIDERRIVLAALSFGPKK